MGTCAAGATGAAVDADGGAATAAGWTALLLLQLPAVVVLCNIRNKENMQNEQIVSVCHTEGERERERVRERKRGIESKRERERYIERNR